LHPEPLSWGQADADTETSDQATDRLSIMEDLLHLEAGRSQGSKGAALEAIRRAIVRVETEIYGHEVRVGRGFIPNELHRYLSSCVIHIPV
jgi:ribosomal protein L13E